MTTRKDSLISIVGGSHTERSGDAQAADAQHPHPYPVPPQSVAEQERERTLIGSIAVTTLQTARQIRHRSTTKPGSTSSSDIASGRSNTTGSAPGRYTHIR